MKEMEHWQLMVVIQIKDWENMEQKSVGAESVMLRSRHGRIIVRVARGEARSFLIFAMLPLCSVFCVHIFSSL